LALRYSYDPLTGRLDVGFDASKEQRDTPPPNVTPSKSKTVPKPTPQGGSAPNPEQPKELIKPYYLSGERPPEGIKTKLEKVDVDGKQRLARVPILPDLTPEQQARVDEAANAQRFAYGYDPKSGEFATGVIDVEKPDPIKTVNEFIERAPRINSVGDALESAANLTPLYNEKVELGSALADAERKGEDLRARELREKIRINNEKLTAESSRRGENFTEDFFVNPLYNFFDSPLDSIDKLATGTALVLGESLGPMVSQLPGQVGAAADVVTGRRYAFDPETFAALTPYYYGLTAADQYLGSYEKLKEQAGDNVDTLVGDPKLDQTRLSISAAGQTAVDIALGKIGSVAGGLLVKPLKSTSILGTGFLPKTLKRATGVTTAIAGGASTEASQEYLNQWGTAVDLGFLDVLDDPQRKAAVTDSALIGGLIAGNITAPVAVGGTATDVSKGIYNKIKGRKPTPVDIIKTEDGEVKVQPKDQAEPARTDGTVTGLNNLDTSDLEVEIETPVEPVKVEEAKVETVAESKAYDLWNAYYTERVNQFEESQKTPRTPTEIYRAGTELGLPVGDIYTKIVGDETTPIDAGTPEVKVANNVIKGVVEAAEAQKFYTDLGTSPEAQELYLDAIADSKNNPERQAKIAKVRRNFPGTPEVVLDTLSDTELDSLNEKLPDTRGMGVQYHGSRAPVDVSTFEEREATYNSDNIYGGDFYTTDAIDVAKGYQRKKQDGITYEVSETAPVKMFDMEFPYNTGIKKEVRNEDSTSPKIVDAFNRFRKTIGLRGPEWQIDVNNLNIWQEWQLDAFRDAIKEDGTVSLRDFMDNARELSPNYDYSKSEVQELFDDIIQIGLREKLGYGGMRHEGGKFTGAKPHNVNIYFDPRNQVELSPLNLERVRIPPAPITEVTEAIKAVDAINSDPAEQLAEINKPIEPTISATPDGLPYNEADDPLAIPAFLDRRKNPRLFSGDRKATYQPGELVNVEYTGTFLPDTPQEVKDAVQPFIDNLATIAREIGSRVVGKGIGRDVDLRLVGEVVPVTLNEDGTLKRDRAEGEYNPEHNAISLAVSSVVDRQIKGETDLNKTQGFLTTAVHEFIHAADMRGFFGDRNDNVFNKSVKDMQKWLEKNTEYGDLMKDLDPVNSRRDRAEVIAYYAQNYIEKSNSKAASAFRRSFGIPKSPDTTGKNAFMEPQGGMKLWMQKAIDTFRYILEAIKARLNNLREVNKTVDEFFSGAFAKQADAAYLNSLQRQAQALYDAKARGQSLFAMKGATGSLKKVDDPIGEAEKKVKQQASLTPEDMGDFRNYMKDPDNVYGYGNKVWTFFSWFRSLGAEARYDQDAAQVLNLTDAVEKAKTEYLRAFGPLIDWIQTITNEKGERVDKNGNPVYGKYMQVMLDLRKQSIDLNDVDDMGRVIYKNRNGKQAALSPYTVNVIKELTKAFSVPMKAMDALNRTNLGHLNSYPGSDIPNNGTVDELVQWVENRKKAFKDSVIGPSPEDKKHLDQAVTIIDMIVQIDEYINGNRAYVPELRKGSWGIDVRDKNGKQLGLYTIEPQGGFINYAKPDVKTVQKARIEILKRYRGIDGVQVGKEAFELTNNRLAKRANAGTADLHLLMSLLAQQSQGMLSKEFSKKGIEGVSVADILASSANTIAENLSNASTAEGWKARFLKSRHIDGASEDWQWVMDSFFSSAASSLAYIQYKNTVDKVRSAYGAYSESNSPLGMKAARRLADLDYALSPAHDAPVIRGLSYTWGLAFRPSTAIIQSSPLFSLVPEDMISLGVPPYKAYGALKGAVSYMNAFITETNFKDYLKSKSYFSEETLDKLMKYFGKDKEMRAYARDAIEKDTIYLNAALVEEALGDIRRELKYTKGMKGSGQKALDNAASAGGFAMNAMERSSRTGMYMAYIKEFYNNPDRIRVALDRLNKEPKFTEFRRFNPDMDDVRAITTYSVQQVFGNPSKSSRPRYTRGRAGAVISPFMGIPAQMWEKTVQEFFGLRGLPGFKGAITGMASAMLMFGAKAGFPTFFIVAPVLMEMFREPDEPGELQIKQMIVDYLGIKPIARYLGWSEKQVLDTVMGGMTYAVAGVDVSSRVGNAMPFSNLVADMATTLRGGDTPAIDDITGIIGNTASNIPKAIGQMMSGRMSAAEGFSMVLPAFVRDITKAGIMASGDTLKTASGKPLMDTTDISTGDIIAQALGFSPKSVQDAQLRNRAVNMATSYRDSDKTLFKNKLVNLGVKIKRESDPARRYELKREYNDLRKQFLMIAMELKKTDPERYEAFFSPSLVKRFFKDVDEGILFELDPKRTEGLSTNAKIKLEKFKGITE